MANLLKKDRCYNEGITCLLKKAGFEGGITRGSKEIYSSTPARTSVRSDLLAKLKF